MNESENHKEKDLAQVCKAPEAVQMPQHYLGISEDRLHHILGVARTAYKIAKQRGHEEEFARKMFLLGWLHDVGYEFSEKQEDHASRSIDLLMTIVEGIAVENFVHSSHYQAIRSHGQRVNHPSEEWVILNLADMTVDSTGRTVTIKEWAEDILRRYGEGSSQYQTFCKLEEQIKQYM